ncbi:hypothetical protein HDU98_005288 [Podochytrium sp. JEL0797]|nr:hypothetical protein HDU98_005288 [Podochytrium sp. JEL0797]
MRMLIDLTLLFACASAQTASPTLSLETLTPSLATSLGTNSTAPGSPLSHSFCAKPFGRFCLDVSLSGTNTATLTVRSMARGWAAVGLGTHSMSANAPVFVAWANNANTQYIVSQRSVVKEIMPLFERQIQTVQTPWHIDSNGSWAIHFSFVMNQNMFHGTSLNAIYAFSDTGPVNRDLASSNFNHHDDSGSFTLILNQAALPNNNNSTDKPSSLTSSQSLSTYCSDDSNIFCLIALRDTTAGTVILTVYSTTPQLGWIAFGTGTQMSGSTMLVAWSIPGTSTIIFSPRVAMQGESQPIYTPSAFQYTPVTTPSIISIPSSATFNFSVSMSLADSLFISSTQSSPFIYALSPTPPTTPSDASSSFPHHSTHGVFSIDVSTLGSVTTGTQQSDTVVTSPAHIAHGVFMFLAWGVFPFLGVFTARYLKSRLGHAWFGIHVACLGLGVGGCMVAGLVAVEVSLAEGKSRFIQNGAHGWIGVVLAFMIYPLQVILGVLANAWYNPERRKTPLIDSLHAWVGRGVAVLAVVNMQLGLLLIGAGAAVVACFWVWVCGVVGVFVVAERWMGKSVDGRGGGGGKA